MAAPIMPHYVNIAWGFIFWLSFLFWAVVQLFGFCFLHLKNQLISKSKIQCAACVLATKTVTKNRTEGLASGRAFNTGGVWQNTLKLK